jgi:hypothetical protein
VPENAAMWPTRKKRHNIFQMGVFCKQTKNDQYRPHSSSSLPTSFDNVSALLVKKLFLNLFTHFITQVGVSHVCLSAFSLVTLKNKYLGN